MLCGFGIARARSELDALRDSEGLALLSGAAVSIVDGNAYTSRAGPRVVDGAERIRAALSPRPGPDSPRWLPGEVRIAEADDLSALATARTLFQEYAESLGIDLCFQDFATELATLPGAYARPAGRLLLASVEQQIAGCVGAAASWPRRG